MKAKKRQRPNQMLKFVSLSKVKKHPIYIFSYSWYVIPPVMIFPTLFLSYVIVYLHFLGHLFFILGLLIYDYSSTVAYSGAYSRIAHALIHALIHAQPYCTVYKDRVDTIVLSRQLVFNRRTYLLTILTFSNLLRQYKQLLALLKGSTNDFQATLELNIC